VGASGSGFGGRGVARGFWVGLGGGADGNSRVLPWVEIVGLWDGGRVFFGAGMDFLELESVGVTPLAYCLGF
jgi:hypothetical protein